MVTDSDPEEEEEEEEFASGESYVHLQFIL